MAGIDGHGRDKMAIEMFNIFVVVYVFNSVSSCVATVESHGQAFIQTDNELRYMVDGHIDGVPLHVIPGSNIQDMGIPDGSIPISPIRFEPPMLDFQEQPVGMPHMEQVTVHNPDTQNSLHLLSISGSTLHFHCSFFQDKMVPPGGNTTFDVVFLARQVGNVENTLYIHTSQGSFKYQVFGVGVPNPYRIRPYLGAKVPLNSSYSPLIQMHNPHSSTLQIVEMYSSGGDLHLELPTGEKEAPRNLWEIPPYETKPVMRASFVGRLENNHTAFIRIKTNRDKDEVLTLPVEVEVTSAPGIFSPLEMLDFGILRTLDGQNTLRLNLLNSGSKPVHITSVTVSPPNEAINIEFRPVKLQPDVVQATPVALISYTASKAVHPKQCCGKIIVKTKNGQYKLSIPYQASVLHGSLVFDRNKTIFYTGGQTPVKNISQELELTNTFNFTVVLYNATLPPEARQYFSIQNFTSPVMLRPQQSLSVLVLSFHPNTSHLHLTTELQLYTNASIFSIPIIVYNGKLKVIHHRPEMFKGQLDFGTLGIGERRTMTYTLRNDNPVDIVIREFGANWEKTSVELLGIQKGNGTTLTQKHNVSEIGTNPLIMKPYHFAVFKVNLVAPSQEGTFAAEVLILSQFENLYIPITLRTAEGSLNAVPDKLVLDKCFPTRLVYQDMRIRSSFSSDMEVRHVTFQPNDTRFYFVPPAFQPAVLMPHRDSTIGRIYFDPKRECKEDCFVGLPTYLPAGHQWLLGATLDKEVADTDQYLYTRFRQKWDMIGLQQQSTVNMTIQVDTNHVRGFLFPAQAHLHWPSLSEASRIHFPLTQIRNSSETVLQVENPADVPVLMQFLPLSSYPNPQTILDMVGPSLPQDLADYIEMDDPDVFYLPDLDKFKTDPESEVSKSRKIIENTLGVKPSKNSVSILVSPRTAVQVRLGFMPKDDLSHTSLIVIRNNLTVVDTVVVQGQGGRGEMRFSNKKAGTTSPLLFEMTEKHLKGCDKKKQSKSIPPNFTVRRPFTARNTGQLPFYVHGFSINDSPCEGYGFKVLDCEGFELQPNASRKIDIAFTPDFTMSRMRRVLSIYTSLGPSLNFTLQATIPAHMLTKCAAALPRPSWEPILYYSTVCIMLFLLFCIIVASYFEADRLFTADIMKKKHAKVSSATQTFVKGKVFDLRTIAGVKPTADSNGTTKVHPPSKPTTPVITNGHMEPPRKKKDTSHTQSITSFIRNFFFRQKSQENPPANRPNPDLQLSKEKDEKITSSSSSTSTIPSNIKLQSAPPERQSTPHETADKTPLYLKLNNKRSKAAKRQNSDLISSDSSSINCNERKLASKDIPSCVPHLVNAQRVFELDTKASSEKDFNKANHDIVRSSNPKKTYERMIDLSEPPEVTIITEDDEGNTARKDATDKKTKARKSKAMIKAEARERRLKEKQRRQEILLENDRDETSSTTTESSSADADDKSSARDSTPEPQPPKKKVRNKKDKKRTEADADEDANEEEFIITSKSKAHKKIKVDPKNAFGGNILRPRPPPRPQGRRTLELPYTTKLEAAKNSELKSEASTANAITDRPLKKNNKNKTKAKAEVRPFMWHDPEGNRGNEHETDSPEPFWDIPKTCPQDDFGELALQTEQFAARHGIMPRSSLGLSSGRGMSPDPLSSSSRSSSYSSVVSNGSTDSTNKFKGTKFPGGAVEVNKKISGYGQNMDSKAPGGTIGTRSGVSKPTSNAIGNLRQKNPWNVSPGSPTTPEPSSHMFGLHTIQESQQPPLTVLPDGEVMSTFPNTNAGAFGMTENAAQFGLAGGYDQQPVTMMQRLQLERRKRLREYQQKLLNGEDWPGFNLNQYQESLWDDRAPDTWSSITDSPPRPEVRQMLQQASNAIWDPQTSTASGNWNPATSIWTSGSAEGGAADAGPHLDIPGSGTPSPLGAATDNGNTSPQPAVCFDPFNTLGNIWRPSSAGGAVGAWGFPSKSDEADGN